MALCGEFALEGAVDLSDCEMIECLSDSSVHFG